METKDPALTKTPISSHESIAKTQTNTIDTSINEHTNGADELKGTQTLQETVIGSDFIENMDNLDTDTDTDTASMANRDTRKPIMGESVSPQGSLRTAELAELAERDVTTRDHLSEANHNELEADTSVTNGTDTFNDKVNNTEHINDGDNPARQPDRRDQQGSTAFDDGINEDTVGSKAPKSEGINDMNRYASVENAQSRILNPDEKD